jgi:ribose 5-phosphate isomerase A
MNLKRKAAQAALKFINDEVKIVGIGSGSTVQEFISSLAEIKHKIDGCVSSSIQSSNLLKKVGIPVLDLNVVDGLPIYVDGADEINNKRVMIKGGGGALVREKILAVNAREFICIIDYSKLVYELGKFPVAIEVLPIARSYVAREMLKLGGSPVYRQGFVSDNGNIILDVYNLPLEDVDILEDKINCIPGVVDNGIFARRRADKIVMAKKSGEVDIF